MQPMSDRVRAKLEVLARKFQESLPERVLAIESAYSATNGTKSDSEEVLILRNHAHKLAGSGTTFGYKKISERGKSLELYLDELMAAQTDITAEQSERIRSLIDAIAAQAREVGGDEVPERTADLNDPESVSVALELEHRLVCMASDDSLVPAELERQLQFFGFPTRRTDEFRNLDAISGDRMRLVLLVSLSYMRSTPEIEKRIREARSAAPARVSIIFISENDDFDTRLYAVRAGGSAFFSIPVDVARLVDKIDTVSEEGELSPYHIMIIGNDVDAVSENALILQNAGMITSVATDPRTVFRVLVESRPEIIIVGMELKGCSGVELARLIRQQEAFVGIPIVFLADEKNPEIQIEAIRNGGDDFIETPVHPRHLVARITIRAQRTRAMRFFMERDSLTGLLNHAHLAEGLAAEIRRAERIGNELCFAMIDIDHFKGVNDLHGHLTGDRVLKSLARLLQDRLRKTDIIGRYGGEEFGVIFFNTSAVNTARVVNEIRESFSRIRHISGDQEFFVSFSCGVAEYPTFDNVSSITSAADKALYQAKSLGRNRVVVAE